VNGNSDIGVYRSLSNEEKAEYMGLCRDGTMRSRWRGNVPVVSLVFALRFLPMVNHHAFLQHRMVVCTVS
jgi:hypothetical protein